MLALITYTILLQGSYNFHQVRRTLPIFIRVQLLSICWLAWRKYRPSVHIAAYCSVTMAVPTHHNKHSRFDISNKQSFVGSSLSNGWMWWNSQNLVYLFFYNYRLLLSVTCLIYQLHELCLHKKLGSSVGQSVPGSNTHSTSEIPTIVWGCVSSSLSPFKLHWCQGEGAYSHSVLLKK